MAWRVSGSPAPSCGSGKTSKMLKPRQRALARPRIKAVLITKVEAVVCRRGNRLEDAASGGTGLRVHQRAVTLPSRTRLKVETEYSSHLTSVVRSIVQSASGGG